MLNDIELELVYLFSQAELNSLQPHPISDTHPDYEIVTYFNSSLNKMKFGRHCLKYCSVSKDTGFTIKELTHDMQISEVAVRDMIKTCVEKGWMYRIDGRNHYNLTEESIAVYVAYIKSRIKHEQLSNQRITQLLTTLYTLKENLK